MRRRTRFDASLAEVAQHLDTEVTETFDAEGEYEPEQQRQGWQSILNNFAKHVESKV